MASVRRMELQVARKMVDAMIDYALNKNLKMTVAVVDSNDTLMCFAKMDGAVQMTAQLAINKAHSAIVFGKDTIEVADYLITVRKDPTWFMRWGDPRFVPIPGGVLIRSLDGLILGAVGTSGGLAEEDEEVARVGARTYFEP